METYYQILNISEAASFSEIKAAYKKMAFNYHPDRNPYNRKECHDKMTKINQAYSVLNDPLKKSDYDALLRAQRGYTFVPNYKEATVNNQSEPASGFNWRNIYYFVFILLYALPRLAGSINNENRYPPPPPKTPFPSSQNISNLFKPDTGHVIESMYIKK